ncbi:MAG TPA: DsbA family protein [Actinomycetota bacterium]|nr:DsbA family protein [Actinomycetota bacterium]
MTDRIRFHFDPRCPWAWQTSKWMRDVAARRGLDIDWRLFSLAVINAAEGEANPLHDPDAKGTPALRTLALVQKEAGSEAVGRLYETMGTRLHERKEAPTGETLSGALEDAGLDPGIVARALDDPSTVDIVMRDHDAVVTEVGAFGVPTIVLESSGRGIFGPVLTRPPATEELADQLWDHVRWLIDAEGFYELKRERDRGPGE